MERYLFWQEKKEESLPSYVKKAALSAESEVSLSQGSVVPSGTVLAGPSSSSPGLVISPVISLAPTGSVSSGSVLAGYSSSRLLSQPLLGLCSLLLCLP